VNGPCLCGSSDCKKCFPDHFRRGVYLDPDQYCDECREYRDGEMAVCEWCNRQMCERCAERHNCREGAGDE
jgi:hypothetical protein